MPLAMDRATSASQPDDADVVVEFIVARSADRGGDLDVRVTESNEWFAGGREVAREAAMTALGNESTWPWAQLARTQDLIAEHGLPARAARWLFEMIGQNRLPASSEPDAAFIEVVWWVTTHQHEVPVELRRPYVAETPAVADKRVVGWVLDTRQRSLRSKLAGNEFCHPDALVRLSKSTDENVISALAGNPASPADVLARIFAGAPAARERSLLAGNPSTPRDIVIDLVRSDPGAVAGRADFDDELARAILDAHGSDGWVHVVNAKNNLPVHLQRELAEAGIARLGRGPADDMLLGAVRGLARRIDLDPEVAALLLRNLPADVADRLDLEQVLWGLWKTHRHLLVQAD